VQTTLPPLFVAAHGTRLRLASSQVVVERVDGTRMQLPIEQIGGVVVLGRGVDCSSGLMLALAERGRATVFLGAAGEVTGLFSHPCAPRGRALEARAAQHAIERARRADGSAAELPRRVARGVLNEKLLAIEAILAQHDRSHADVDLTEPRRTVADFRARIAANADDIDQLRGIEGAASAAYWQAMPALFRGGLTTARRTRRPPRDECNAALSFGYALLLGEMCAAIALEGLEPALGVLHPPDDSGARPSLALDLMEPWRHAVIDRLVLRAANRRELGVLHFEKTTDEGGEPVVMLNADGRREFLSLYSQAMQSGCGAGGGTVRGALFRAVRAHAELIISAAEGPTAMSQDDRATRPTVAAATGASPDQA
jgi:CRISPR-associated protein Cas1